MNLFCTNLFDLLFDAVFFFKSLAPTHERDSTYQPYLCDYHILFMIIDLSERNGFFFFFFLLPAIPYHAKDFSLGRKELHEKDLDRQL